MANRSKKVVFSTRITYYGRELLALVSKDEGRSIARITDDWISTLGTEEQKRKARAIADVLDPPVRRDELHAAAAPMAVRPEEAARLAGVSRSAIYAAMANGEGDLVSFKVGKRRLILIEELKAWLSRMAKAGRS